MYHGTETTETTQPSINLTLAFRFYFYAHLLRLEIKKLPGNVYLEYDKFLPLTPRIRKNRPSQFRQPETAICPQNRKYLYL